MNKTTVTFEALYQSLMFVMPGAVLLIIVAIMIFFSFLVGVKYSDYIWKSNVKYHLPKIKREVIQAKDNEITELKKLISKYKIENKSISSYLLNIKRVIDIVEKDKNLEG